MTDTDTTTDRGLLDTLTADPVDPDPHLTTILQAFKAPLTIWIVGYNAIALLPKALPVTSEGGLFGYLPGLGVQLLGKGELAYEGLFILSGIAAGTKLVRATKKDESTPPRKEILKFYLSHLVSIVPAAASAVGVLFLADLASRTTEAAKVENAGRRVTVASSALKGWTDPERNRDRLAHFWAVTLDWQFYLLAPWAFSLLKGADRGAAPRTVLLLSTLGVGLKYLLDRHFTPQPTPLSVTSATSLALMPWLHTPNAGARDQLYLRFPAFFAGMALAVERSRKGHPSHRNLVIGAVASAGIWGALLFAPNVGGPSYASARAAMRLPLATVATYFAMRPFVAYPAEEVFKSEWQQKVHKILTHPYAEAFGTISLTTYLVHKEVISAIYKLARSQNWLAGGVTDAKVLALWLGVVGVSGAAAAGIYTVLEQPALRVLKGWFRGKINKVN
ncbi:hypothetical protein HDV00_009642 [Rhizophlyctis rosea]|nr:hypothetical protein HDV00_009642 [Rhizophlyctis rosea]